ncbi:MAG: hypothetical protein HUU35_17465 [Armatimonadetes bacterium]|nr:hypothetical protein [Armatimonadota bacterium]
MEQIQQTIGYFAGLGSRVAGYPGAGAAARFVEAELRGIGLDKVAVQEYDVSIPMEKTGRLRLVGDGTELPLHGLWPNLVKTSTLPEGGLQGQLIDGGRGELRDLDGKTIEGNVVLLDFNSGDRWLNCAYLGAAAVLFVEPDSLPFTSTPSFNVTVQVTQL